MIHLIIIWFAVTVGTFGLITYTKRSRKIYPKLTPVEISQGYDNIQNFYIMSRKLASYDARHPGVSPHEATSLQAALPKDISITNLSDENLQYIVDEYHKHYDFLSRDKKKYIPNVADALEVERKAYKDAIKEVDRKHLK